MPGGRNPTWTRDELILALDLYLRHRDPLPSSAQHPDIVELSALLRSLPIHPEAVRQGSFRNAAGVSMKLANFRWIDPDLPGGYSAVGQGDRDVWAEFSSNFARLHETAHAIRLNHLSPEVSVEPDELDEGAPEGRVLFRLHKSRERNRTLVQSRKNRAMQQFGKLQCEVCGFDFREAYGELGDLFIECHHTIPVSQLAPGQTTKKADLALVCANCHRMLHQGGKVTSIARLREVMAEAKDS